MPCDTGEKATELPCPEETLLPQHAVVLQRLTDTKISLSAIVGNKNVGWLARVASCNMPCHVKGHDGAGLLCDAVHCESLPKLLLVGTGISTTHNWRKNMNTKLNEGIGL